MHVPSEHFIGVAEGHGQEAWVTAQVPSEHLIGVACGHVLVEEGQEDIKAVHVPSEHFIGVAEGHGQEAWVTAQVPSEHVIGVEPVHVEPAGQPACAYACPFVHTQIPLEPVGVAPEAHVQGACAVEDCAMAHVPPVEEELDVEEVQDACVTAQVLSEHLIGVEEGHGQANCVAAQVLSEHKIGVACGQV